MTERPITFGDKSVSAILVGRKTQTRRVVKPAARVAMIEEIQKKLGRVELHLWEGDVFCPHGDPGDRLWVRETWTRESAGAINAGHPPIIYRATSGDECLSWKPSIHMSREQSRIMLEVVRVRVERLQEISEADAEAEGVHLLGVPEEERYPEKRIAAFHELWDMINAKRGYPWASNPWVWVVEFKVLTELAESEEA